MAGRQNKVGLDYFELDCHMDEKVKLIRAEYGLKGFAVVVMMYQHIYGGDHGYYCEWDDERLLLFMSDNGLVGESKNLIDEVVRACIRRGIFSDRLYKEYGILTSRGVQKQYLKATAKREVVNLIKEYLLLSVPKKRSNVVINSISGGRNSISGGRNGQSKEEKSREYSLYARAERFNDFFGAYPKQKNMAAAEKAYTLVLLGDQLLSEQDLVEAAANYSDAMSALGTEELYMKNPDRFLRDGVYMDYLSKNYKRPKKPRRVGKPNGFNDFPQRGYDMDCLEKQLLGRGGTPAG